MKLAAIATGVCYDPLLYEWGPGRGFFARKLATHFMKFLNIVKEETKELLLAYLIKTPGPLADVGMRAAHCLTDPKDENLRKLGYAIMDAAKLPVAFVGLGYVALVLPMFGVGATGIIASKAFGWLAYILYRIACKTPQYREIMKTLFPRHFLPKDLQQEVEQEREAGVEKARAKRLERKDKERDRRFDGRHQVKLGVEQLPPRESRERPRSPIQ